ncbi:riboflavin kinase [Candidatus Daviesbacteria bacterium]|nr:riboflavin kinase [Candidatus Daviesbacteria bacterium]
MYRFWGKVRKANLRGKKLGFPTANVNLSKKIPEGVYISKTKIKNNIYFSLTFIGTVKTFDEKKFLSETYILDFNQNIYNHWISVKLIKKIRENQQFRSANDLIRQMKQDEREARAYFLSPLLTT